MNKEKAIQKLKDLSWEELDWLQEECRRAKPTAKGPRVYRIDGSESAEQRRAAAKSLSSHLEEVCFKHHGEYVYEGMDHDY